MFPVIVSSLLQVGIVLLVAAAVYLAMRRPGRSFLRFVGLFPAPLLPIAAGALVGLAAAFALLAVPGVAGMASGVGTVAGDAARAGSSALVPGLLVAAIFKTALSEELLFRGLIGKRLIARLGFRAGNLIQAALFGLVHLLILLVPTASAALVAVMVLVTGLMGWFNGWLNEKGGKGSILPGWAAHSVANICAYLYVLYVAMIGVGMAGQVSLSGV